mgnify:CR=1 FL=1
MGFFPVFFLLKALHVSPYYLSHVFKETSGYSPTQYVVGADVEGLSHVLEGQGLAEVPVNERLDLPAQVLGLRVLPDPGVPGELEWGRPFMR